MPHRAEFGFLTTASFIWKSADGDNSFHLVAAQQPPLGKPDTSPVDAAADQDVCAIDM